VGTAFSPFLSKTVMEVRTVIAFQTIAANRSVKH
jgi:hypothetical protein